jgi:Antitoxin VbhA
MLSSSIFADAPISTEERTLRFQAVAQARASLRLEGTVLPMEIEELNRQYIAGELSTSEYVQKVIQAADAIAKTCASS